MPRRNPNPTTDYQQHLEAASRYANQALSNLAARDQAALAAKDNGATYEQIAKAIGLTKPGAQSLIRNARNGDGWSSKSLSGLRSNPEKY